MVDTPLARSSMTEFGVTSLDQITAHNPVARPGTPADIAHACEYLCSDTAGYVTGQTINVNGGSWM